MRIAPTVTIIEAPVGGAAVRLQGAGEGASGAAATRQAPQAVRPMPAHAMTFSSQKHAIPSVAVTRVLRREVLHGLLGRGIAPGRTDSYPRPEQAIWISSQARRERTTFGG